jgi:hypothetical protein
VGRRHATESTGILATSLRQREHVYARDETHWSHLFEEPRGIFAKKNENVIVQRRLARRVAVAIGEADRPGDPCNGVQQQRLKPQSRQRQLDEEDAAVEVARFVLVYRFFHKGACGHSSQQLC